MDLRMYMGDITTLFDESSRKSVQVQFSVVFHYCGQLQQTHLGYFILHRKLQENIELVTLTSDFHKLSSNPDDEVVL